MHKYMVLGYDGHMDIYMVFGYGETLHGACVWRIYMVLGHGGYKYIHGAWEWRI